MDFKKMKAGQIANLFAVVFVFVMVIVLVIYVALPTLNTGLTSSSANFNGYPGASGIGQATYIVSTLALLAGAAMLVTGLLGGRL